MSSRDGSRSSAPLLHHTSYRCARDRLPTRDCLSLRLRRISRHRFYRRLKCQQYAHNHGLGEPSQRLKWRLSVPPHAVGPETSANCPNIPALLRRAGSRQKVLVDRQKYRCRRQDTSGFPKLPALSGRSPILSSNATGASISRLNRLATSKNDLRRFETFSVAMRRSSNRIMSAFTRQSRRLRATASTCAIMSLKIGVPRGLCLIWGMCRTQYDRAASATPGSSPKRTISQFPPPKRTQLARALC